MINCLYSSHYHSININIISPRGREHIGIEKAFMMNTIIAIGTRIAILSATRLITVGTIGHIS